MSDYFPIEALKAQAVAARNYTLASIGKHNAQGYNLCDTTIVKFMGVMIPIKKCNCSCRCY